MWLMHQSPSLDLIHMLEAALIMANCHHSGCRNAKGSGGEGGLNRAKKLPPPYFVYITGCSANQPRRVGWKNVATCFYSFGKPCPTAQPAQVVASQALLQPQKTAKNLVPWFWWCAFAKACCKHVVKVARDEVDRNPGASQAMREFANIRDADAEIGARRVFVKFGLAAPINISWLPLGPDNALKQLPWIKLSTWIGHLLDLGALPRQFVGVSSFTKMKGVLTEFWKRYRATDAGHPVFALERDGVVTLDRMVPFFTHSDEGRTFRDLPLWVLNVHGVIGRGTLSWLKAGQHRKPVERNAQGLNFVGNTWATHCLITTMIKQVCTPEAISKVSTAFAEDVAHLQRQGITATNGSGQHIWMCHLAAKGDLPALAKLARFTRTFGHAPRAASSRKACLGVCWQCLGGQERDDAAGRSAYPYEDLSPAPIWEPTIGQEAPWIDPPAIIAGLELDDARAAQFFQSDFFHNVHLGILKAFTSSSLVAVVECTPPLPFLAGHGSVEAKFQELTKMYLDFYEGRGYKPFATELSRDTCCWPQSGALPAAKWNKGMATVQVMRFLDFLGQNHLSQSGVNMMTSIVSQWHSGSICRVYFCFWRILSHQCPP